MIKVFKWYYLCDSPSDGGKKKEEKNVLKHPDRRNNTANLKAIINYSSGHPYRNWPIHEWCDSKLYSYILVGGESKHLWWGSQTIQTMFYHF